MIMKKLLIFSIAISLSFFSNAQQQKLDSLSALLREHNENDSTKINIKLELARTELWNDPLVTFKLANEACTLSKHLGYNKGIIASQLLIGNSYTVRSNYDSAKYYYSRCREFSEQVHNDLGAAKAIKNIGALSYYQGDYDQAIELHKVALDYFQKANEQKEVAMTHVNIGVFYKNKNEYLDAISHYLSAAQVFHNINDSSHIATIYNNIGGLRQDLGEDDKALEYFQNAYDIWKTQGSHHDLGIVLNNIGGILIRKARFDSALSYFKKSLYERRLINEEAGICQSYYNIGDVYQKTKLYDSALFYFNRSIELGESIGLGRELITAYNHIAQYYLTTKNYQSAYKYALRAKTRAKENNIPDLLRDAFSILYKVDSINENYKSGLKHLSSYIQLKDSIFNFTKARMYNEILTRYEVNQKEKQIYQQQVKIASQNNSILEKEFEYKNMLITLLIIISILVAVSSIYFIGNLRKSKKLLEANVDTLKKQLDPHFLFNSLNVLSNLIHKDPNRADDFLMELSKLYKYILDNIEKKYVLVAEEINFAQSFFQASKIRYGDSIRLETNFDVSEVRNAKIPPLSLQLLLENAIKHNHRSVDSPIVIQISNSNNQLTVKNNTNPRQDITSTGIGLKNLAEIYKIRFKKKIKVHQRESSFEVSIPIINEK